MRREATVVVLGILSPVACASTVSRRRRHGGRVCQRGTAVGTGTIVFNRLGADGIAVYRLDLDAGTEDSG